ncbi:HlyD family efflux transporter periplasmic adaptor subunit [Dyella nitratireducens]|uniref:Hemolysin D n=1 Tax=Dyella nitratireducens TaxID=1849580 RepID=A0ABQ1FW48_9GAMM|nr:HlyD family efflux transporter periplasmic adaptor subunit [Dyella nitratireducens]GGA31499.1 hemolysin D [Dyella nitratireducens]GLQ42861.1 hemolysin D [Dyella nitratireducens]
MAQLPSLRQELSLTRGAAAPDGSPTWMLHDPAANQFYQLGWPAFEMLSRWTLDDAHKIVDAVNDETTLTVSLDDFEALLRLLQRANLFVSASADSTEHLRAVAEASRMTHAMWLLKHYLLIRIPLWHPMPFLRRCARHVEFVYKPAFWTVVGICALIGLALVSRRWDSFVHTFRAYADWHGLLAIGLTLAFAKVLHEFGHAFTAYRYGCRVPTMGIAVLVMVPMLYTDTTEAWKVPSRSARLHIGAAGILAELALAAFATLAWSLLPDGPLSAAAFLLATTTWISTVTINASPFMRFDGYFLLSDWLGMPNLHDRAFAFGRWWMREWLFGFGDPQPEPCTPGRRRFLIGFTYVTWLYRLVVFLSIALIVYHTFFKALGMLLFAVEFGWFIVRPMVGEVAACWRRRDELRWRKQTVRSVMLGTFLLGWLVLPWHNGVGAPAVLGPLRAQGLYAPEAGYVSADTALPRDGAHVHAGDVLAVLVSPDLEYRLKVARADEALLHWQVEQQSFDQQLLEEGVALRKRWEAARETVAGLERQTQQLTLRAPFAGTVQTDGEGLASGTWLPRGEHLFDVIGPTGIKGEAFVDEEGIGHVAAGDSARFLASVPEIGTLHCQVTAVDRVNLATLDEPATGTPYGGPIPAEKQPATHQLVPVVATYRVRIGNCRERTSLSRQMVGTAKLGHARESYAWRMLMRLVAVVEREAGG